jgi:hypothetical protein
LPFGAITWLFSVRRLEASSFHCAAAAHRGAAAGGLHAEGGVVVGLVGRRLLDADLAPVGVEFFGQQHRDRGGHALPHLDRAGHHGHAVVGRDAQEGVRHEHRPFRGGGAGRDCAPGGAWQCKADHQCGGTPGLEEAAPRGRCQAAIVVRGHGVERIAVHAQAPLFKVTDASLMAARIWL